MTEYDIQVAVFEWARWEALKFPCLNYMHSSGNGLKLPIGLAVKAKKSGLLKGVPDICLPYRNNKYSGLYIELKKEGGKASPEQLNFIKYLLSQGYYAEVIKGYNPTITLISNYLRNEI